MLTLSVVRIMMIRSIYRRLLASLMLILFLLGMTGFNIEEHKCAHCGTDYSLILLNNNTEQLSTCNVNTKTDCCSDNEDMSTDKTLPDSCDIGTEDCCQYSYNPVSLEDPVQLIISGFDFDSPITIRREHTKSSDHTNPVYSKIEIIAKRLSGREMIVLNSQFLS